MPNQPTYKSPQQGVVIVETLIAILIFSIGILGLVGMQANMLKNTGDAKYRADASFVAKRLLGEIWSDPGNLPADLGVTLDVPELPNGKRTVTQPTLGKFEVVITWRQPGEELHQYVATTTIAGDWTP